MTMQMCQSCGMPMNAESDYGTNQDESKNREYCCYCFQEGHFTKNITMEEMIEECADYVDEFNAGSGLNYTREEAILEMKKYFPTLKRWQK
ncbi:zinc ribbon domain-containing protein [Gabonibacter chumensis]|uniref:zinc ribbon domain-containing protein n=1 Tax=Gabonibacter chumensis TaxID=2972474 RepID=UPI002572FCA1|nr:zinc ribbon domain-containing protein [Gabonibacter chumensis]MCR9012113.1 zinc ribbon domain-containing protein [Gabonibacter chumensis]